MLKLIKVYINLVKLFYANMIKQGPKNVIFYKTFIKVIDFGLVVATLDEIFHLKVDLAKISNKRLNNYANVCFENFPGIEIPTDTKKQAT